MHPSSASPPAIVARHQDVLMVRFCRTPDVPTVDLLMDRLREAHAAAGDRLVVVGTIAEGVGHPPASVRAALPPHVQEVKRLVRSIHVAVEGRGLKATMQRTVLSAIAQLLPHSLPFHIHKTFEGALEHIDRESRVTADDVLAEARSHSIAPA